jgi:ABC-type arginine/histidine transport system permease subunit
MFEYLPELMKGLHTSLTLTVASLIVTVIVYVCLSQKSQPGLNKYDVTE